MYLKSGLPVEIIQEYDNWRRSAMPMAPKAGSTSRCSRARAAIAAPWMKGKGKGVFVNMRREAAALVAIIAQTGAGRHDEYRRMQRRLVPRRDRRRRRLGGAVGRSGAPIRAKPSSKHFTASLLLCRLGQRPHRAWSDLLDDDAGGQAAELAAIFQRPALRIAIQEAGGEEIACPCRIDNSSLILIAST
jgi:hypothetical protein